MRSARLIFGAMAIDTPDLFDTRSLYKMAVRRNREPYSTNATK